LVDFLSGYERAIVALEVINAMVLDQLPDLKVISKYGVGLDMIDLEALQERDVRLGWTGGVNRRSVAELVIAFAIMMLRHVPTANREVLAGNWAQHIGGCITGRTVGIIGCGHVGKDLVRLLQSFDCEILAHDIRDYSDFYAANQVQAVDLGTLLECSDIVTLHVPLDPSTRGILSGKCLTLMKPDSILINTARGGLVDEQFLKKMLEEGHLAAAAFDVFSVEPPEDLELLSLPNFFSTPHIGGSSKEAILAMGRAAILGLTDNEIPTRDFG
jgi:D-3-phosphoglycerate dehydrogenase